MPQVRKAKKQTQEQYVVIYITREKTNFYKYFIEKIQNIILMF
jgi:hypothetical protein